MACFENRCVADAYSPFPLCHRCKEHKNGGPRNSDCMCAAPQPQADEEKWAVVEVGEATTDSMTQPSSSSSSGLPNTGQSASSSSGLRNDHSGEMLDHILFELRALGVRNDHLAERMDEIVSVLRAITELLERSVLKMPQNGSK